MSVEHSALRNQRLQELLVERKAYEQRRAQAAEKCLDTAAFYRKEGDEKEEGTDRHLWHDWADEELRKALDPPPDERQALERREQELPARWNDREVWIRTSVGSPLEAYHIGPECGLVSGRGRAPDSFKRVFEGEAKAEGLRPCRVHPCVRLRQSA